MLSRGGKEIMIIECEECEELYLEGEIAQITSPPSLLLKDTKIMVCKYCIEKGRLGSDMKKKFRKFLKQDKEVGE